MLLTITCEGSNTRDLGFLLHKHPDRTQRFDLNFGKAYVFYPEAAENRTTAALLLDIDPIGLVRDKNSAGLFDYVNDRPYAAASFMSTAIVRVFGTAVSGRCDKKQELAGTPLDLTARLYSLKDGGEEGLAERIFEPLGYTVNTKRQLLDERFPQWGDSPYIDLEIRGKVTLSRLLNHLYVLIPVFDRQKHYYMSEDEIEKLLLHGEGWLKSHPCRELIANRYFTGRRSYARKAIDILLENEPVSDIGSDTDEVGAQKHTSLNTLRLNAVKDAVLACGASSVIDMGCGEGKLTSMLLRERQIRRVTACDVSSAVLEKAAKRLHTDRTDNALNNKLTLMQASLTYRDKRFEGYDCACIAEVIEHIEPMRIPAFERSVFGFASPASVVLTTPNREYNANYETLQEGKLRHSDHRFEWTRDEFARWTEHICGSFGYSCVISGIGEADEKYGAPTQMAVFTRLRNNVSQPS